MILKILMYLLMFIMVLVIAVAFMGSVDKHRKPNDRVVDVVVGVIVFTMFLFLIKVFGGYIS